MFVIAYTMQVTRMGDALRRWGAEGSGRPIFYSTEMGGEQMFNADVSSAHHPSAHHMSRSSV